MTTNINFVSEDFALIMTDRRTTYGLKGEGGFTDDIDKLINLENLGWATGLGLYNFIAPFLERLSTSRIDTVDDIVEIYNKVWDRAYRDFPLYRKKLIDSNVSFSFATPNIDGSPNLVIAILREKSETVAILPTDHFRIAPPSDYKGDISKLYICSDEFRQRYTLNDLESNLEKALLGFKEVSEASNVSSMTCDIGIYKKENNQLNKYKLSGNVDELLDIMKKGNISSEIKETL